MTNKKLPDGIVNPFSESFLEIWSIWKQFKMEEFSFQYKGIMSEQMALMNLNTISGMNENVAVWIIKQSMGEGWKGLFPLTDKYKAIVNGEQSKNNGQPDLRNSVQDELNKRYGNREQATN